MSLPVGISKCMTTFGKAYDVLGAEATIKVKITPDRAVVWAATGDVIYPTSPTVSSGDFPSVTFELPHVDQAGFVDVAGDAVTHWYYLIKATITFPDKSTQEVTKSFQPLVGMDSVDLDLVPGGTVLPGVTAPTASVQSLAGETGTIDAATARAALDVLSVDELSTTIDPAPALASVKIFNNGDSWGDKAAATRYADKKLAQRLVERFRMQPLTTDRDVSTSGYTTPQVLGLAETYWTPNDRGVIVLADGGLVNDRDPGGSTASTATVVEAFRSQMGRYHCKAVVANTSPSVQFGGGWSSGVSSAAGSVVDTIVSTDAIELRFGYGATAGQATVKNAAGATLATVNVGGYSTSFTGTVRLTGLGVGNKSLRITVVSGTIDFRGYRVPSAHPPTVVWQVPIVGAATNLPTLVTACKAVLSDYPTVIAVDPAAPPAGVDAFDTAAMLGPDLTHLNEKGQNWFELAAVAAFKTAGLTFRQGQNELTIDDLADTAYTVVSPPNYVGSGATAPSTPSGLSATPSAQIDVGWAIPVDGGATLTSFEVRSSPTGAGTWTTYTGISPTATTYTIGSGLTGGNVYDFEVRAINSVGASAWSSIVTGTPTTPFDITTVTGLKALFRADQITGLVDSDPVGAWNDESGQGNHLAQATAGAKPTYKTAVQNGLPAVRFDGVDDYLSRATLTGGALSQPSIRIFAFKPNALVAQQAFVDGVGSSNHILCRQVSGSHSMFCGTALSSSTPVDTNPHVIAAHCNGASSKLQRDAVDIASGNAGTQTLVGMRQGCDGTTANFSSMDLYEDMTISPIPNSTVLGQIHTYLKAKWGTP